MAEEPSTFSCQDSLPSLPLPDLDETLAKYLESTRPFSTAEQLAKTEALVAEFKLSEGVRLQELLEEKAKASRNWVEQWWEDNAYLKSREPLFPLSNFGGFCDHPDIKPEVGSQCLRAAHMIYFAINYWLMIRRETLPVMKSRGDAWCMYQNYRMYNAARLPRPGKDELVHYFKTEAEGACPSHIVVICNNHFWRFEPLNESGDIHDVSTLTAAFERVRLASPADGLPDLCALTAQDRDRWAADRDHLRSISAENGKFLQWIEEATLVLVLNDAASESATDLVEECVCRDANGQWADKSLTLRCQTNGLFTTNCDHSNVDAIVMLMLLDYFCKEMAPLLAAQSDQAQDNHAESLVDITKMSFETDDRILSGIQNGHNTLRKYKSNLQIDSRYFNDFGNDYFRKRKVYGDTVIQLALQTAYIMQHNKLAPTYETASTRKFFHGRTATVRSCTCEAVELARALVDASQSDESRRVLFHAAVDKHNALMTQACNGRDVDRHLMGLRLAAAESGRPQPALFDDAAWLRSGGDGNFVLSTSFLGYGYSTGVVTPMCAHGYGAFYFLNAGRLALSLCAWKNSGETDVHDFQDNFHWALRQMRRIIEMDCGGVAPC